MLCPCHSQLPYAECCEPYHRGALCPDALKLMRSRYAAYQKDLVDYIIKTTFPRGRVPTTSSVEEFSRQTRFEGLEILEFVEEGSRAWVTFRAQLSQAGKDASFTEKSLFCLENGIWYYVP